MKTSKLIGVVCAWLALTVVQGAPLGTVFSYQGRLVEGGTPATGTYDFQFNLYAASAGGAALTGVLTRNDVAVNSGLFLVELDFGGPPFMGEERWLEISVRAGASIGAYTVLTPRQRLNATPYALYSLKSASAPWSGLSGVPASFADGADNDTTYAPGSGLTLAGTTFSLDTTSLDARYWKLLGNGGTDPGLNFLGTTDNQPLNIRVNNTHAFRVEPNGSSAPHLIGGYIGNNALPGLIGAAIGGGGRLFEANQVLGDYGSIGGGVGNGSAAFARVGGGAFNTASGFGSVVGGGAMLSGGGRLTGLNEASAQASTIGGGVSNRAGGQFSSILGGRQNGASGFASAIGGGENNAVTSSYSTVAGGAENRVFESHATVGGGSINEVRGRGATVSGGVFNRATGLFEFIGGGTNNLASGTNTVVSGGSGNAATALNSVVGGGANNRAFAVGAVIAGGAGNLVSNIFGAIGGGTNNLVIGPASTIAGGQDNQAGGTASTIGGGATNRTFGTHSTVPGGSQNIASGDYSLAAGRRARATHSGSFVWADSTDADFASTAPNQFSIRANGGVALQSSGTALEVRSGSLKVTGAGVGTVTPVFIHRATPATITLHVTKIEHPLCNGDPTAILIVTPNWNPGGGVGVYDNHPIGVYYEDPPTARWHIFNQDGAAMPAGAAFNILVVKP
jgi:hypothetical protein